jgi:subtilisin family serine protease
MRFLLTITVLLCLVACQPTTQAPTPSSSETTGGTSGGSSTTGGSGAASTTPGWSFPTSSSSIQYAFQGLPYSFTVLTGLTGGAWTLTSSQTLPAGLALSQVGTTAVLSGTPTGSNQTLHGLEITATLGMNSQSARFSLFVRGDQLRPFQWHLENDGVSKFSNSAGTLDEDMDVLSVWQAGHYGQGVRIAVSDSGVDIAHTDLSNNMLAGMHRNYFSGTSVNGYLGTPSPMGDAHGTAVSGIIAAQGWNNIGGTGVAPQARVAGFQFINSDQTTDIMIHQASGVFEIFNFSYGTGANFDLEDDALYMEHLRERVTNGRGGLGQIFVKSAGNEYASFCGEVGSFGVVCAPQNANIPMDNNSPFIIVTSASSANGVVASYSNAGSNIWITAPGGEDGDSLPAILTTDLSGCASGNSTTTAGPYTYNQFERYSNSSIFTTYNASCDYTSFMNGTSSSAPNVTGVIALMLSANPNLTWRDVKHILLKTADMIHPAAGNTNHYESDLRLNNYVYEQGWVTNASGNSFHNWYGFGRVNAEAAVAMATSGYTNLSDWLETNPDFDDASEGEYNISVPIPDANSASNPAESLERSVNLALGGLIVESVQVKVQLSHAHSGQMGVELVSPAGTRSILLNINNALVIPYDTDYDPDQDLNVVLTSHAFYGETATGTWTLRLVDGMDDSVSGTLTDWSINILGH